MNIESIIKYMTVNDDRNNKKIPLLSYYYTHLNNES